ncbi:MAG: M48 family metallopeptidase [Thermoguttaceae bacterium]|jgi:Zn-dependent protease with chaperone function
MNFFEHEERAQRKTVRLIVYYCLALLLTFLALHLVIAPLVYTAVTASAESVEYGLQEGDDSTRFLFSAWTNPLIIGIDILIVGLLIGGGTLYKIGEMKRLDGDGVASYCGGRRIDPRTADWKEKRLLNIVEEMAIASGVPVPNVYVLQDEPSINAFAAGFTTSTSVIAVTRGALDYLTRDELQGVIAHEFSHILHQDTRLSMKLVGVLFGLEMVALTGFIIMRAAPRVAPRSDGENNNSAAIIVGVLLFGLALFLIGLFGQLFANVIRAAVSRQREFLADASAVQFTRNPDGIAGALKKIGSGVGSGIDNNKAIEVSHFFFGSIFGRNLFSGLFDSHPNLTTRIKRIDPLFDGVFPKKLEKVSTADQETGSPVSESGTDRLRDLVRKTTGDGGAAAGVVPAAAAAAILDSAGTVTEEKLRVANALLEKIPDTVSAAVNDQNGAIATLLTVLLDTDPELREKQQAFLREQVGEEGLTIDILKGIDMIAAALEGAPDTIKIPIIQKAFPMLRGMSKTEYTKIRNIVLSLMKFDGRIDILEFTIFGFVVNDLDSYFRLTPPVQETFDKPEQIAEPFRKAASCVAYAAGDNPEECRKAFAAAANQIGLSLTILPKEECTPSEFGNALRTLTYAKPRLRETMLKAFYACITDDGYINEREGELIRAITAYFRCPMPSWGG